MWTKVHQYLLGMLLHKTPNPAKFCGDRLKNAGDIRVENLCSPKKWAFKTPIMPNFIEIGQTSLEKSVTKIGPRITKKNYFVTDRNMTSLLKSRLASVREAQLKSLSALY